MPCTKVLERTPRVPRFEDHDPPFRMKPEGGGMVEVLKEDLDGGGGGRASPPGGGGADVGELFVQLGMLVVESRLPADSIKGRQDGPHCPHTVGDWPTHVCDLRQSLCSRASQMRKQIQSLWRNNVPICVEVLVFPDCQHGRQKALITDVPPPLSRDDDSYLLLEQWTIQSVTRRSSEMCVTSKSLFQAMRSYLHFSQLSAWLNLTHGTEPRCIGYRISPPAEFCTTIFTRTPDVHTFPLASLGGRAPTVRVSLARLPRLDDIPQLVCRERSRLSPVSSSTGFSEKSSVASTSVSGRTSITPCGVVSIQCNSVTASSETLESELAIANTPKESLDRESQSRSKPNVFQSQSKQKVSQCQCEDCLRDEVSDKRRPSLEHPAVTLLRRQISSSSSAARSRESVTKRLYEQEDADSDSGRSTPVNCPTKLGDDTGKVDGYSEVEARGIPSKSNASPITIGTTNGGLPKRKPNGFNGAAILKDNNTDSDGSLPDFDLFLSKTLENRRAPLSPEEMEDQLRTLYPSGSSSNNQSCRSSHIKELPAAFVGNLRRISDDKFAKDDVYFGLYNYETKRDTNQDKDGPCNFSTAQTLSEKQRALESSPNSCISNKNDQNSPPVEFKKFEKSSFANGSHKNGRTCSDKRIPESYLCGDAAKNNRISEDNHSNGNSSEENDDVFVDQIKMTCKIPIKSNLSRQIEVSETISSHRELNCENSRARFTVGDADDDDLVAIPSKNGKSIDSGKVLNKNSVCQDFKFRETNGKLTGNRLEVEGGRNAIETPASTKSLHKSVSCPNKRDVKSNGWNLANCLLRTVIKKEMLQQQFSQHKQQSEQLSSSIESEKNDSGVRLRSSSQSIPTSVEQDLFKKNVRRSANMIFHASTGLPLQSSPVPAKKMPSGSFDYDDNLHNNVRAIKNSLSCINLDKQQPDNESDGKHSSSSRMYSTSAPASTNCLLGNFEESLINGRIEPAGVVDGFTVEIGASGSFCPRHLTLPVTAFFFSLSEDNAPSPYLGHIDLENYSKRGYHIPNQGTVQVTLFNPSKTVVKMFVVTYDVSDMQPNSQTFLRQRTLYMPVKGSPSDVPGATIYLRYLIHLRFVSTKTNKIYLHTDIRIIFARDKFELDSRVANYEMRSFTEGPVNPKYSPKK